MKVARAAVALLFVLLLLALPAQAGAQTASVVGGTLNYRDRTTLPASAVVTVQIARVEGNRAPEVIAEQRFTTNGAQPPFRFSLPYDPARIDQNATYTVQANIAVSGQARYTSNALVPVITRGNPTQNVVVNLVATGRLPNTNAGSLPLLVAGVALLAAFGVAGVRRTRS